MNLLTEIRAQFSISEWLHAMKQGIKELFNQWSLREWLCAFFAYYPNATGKRVSGSVRTIPGGTPNEIYQALTNLQKQFKTN